MEGIVATLLFASSFSRLGRGSVSSPWPGPVLMTLRGSAPTKLYRPMVSVVAALSNKKESFDLDLPASQPSLKLDHMSHALTSRRP